MTARHHEETTVPVRLVAIVALALLSAVAVGTSVPDRHAGHVHAAPAEQSSAPECQVVPLGALPGQPQPIWCSTLGADEPTFVDAPNAWLDDFNQGSSLTSLGTGYVQGFRGDGRGLHWRHADHWMVDIQAQTGQYPTLIAAFMKPNKTFRPVNGKLVIEFEVAVPVAGTRDVDRISDSWPELVLSTAPEPSTTNPWGSWLRPNGTYLYEAFPQAWAFGCRMQQSRHPICALYKPSTPGVPNYAGGPDRLWEINQNGGDVTSQFGGDPSIGNLASLWAACGSNQDPDTVCRNHFRWELSEREVKLFVRKPGASQFSLYYQAGLIDANLGQILNAPGGVHVFFGDFAYRITNGTVIRFHWDRLAVNPDLIGGHVPSTNTPTPVPPTPTPTNTTASPTATLTNTAVVAPATATPMPTARAPAAPSSLTAARIGWRIALNWVDNATNEAKFVIERSTDNFSSVDPFEVPANTTGYRDTTVQARTTYSYRVFAVSATGLRSGPSNVATVSTR
jgi:hypothetical protein